MYVRFIPIILASVSADSLNRVEQSHEIGLISHAATNKVVLYGSHILKLSGNFSLCACVLHNARHSTLTQLYVAQKFGAYRQATNGDRKHGKRGIRR